MKPLVKELIFRSMPIYHDILDLDLNEPMGSFFSNEILRWGIVVAAAQGSWDEHVRIPGKDWEVRCWPSGQLAIPNPQAGAIRTGKRRLKQNCALVSINTGATKPNEARDIGREAVRGLLALIRREIPSILPDQVLWEGPFTYTKPGGIKMAVGQFDLESRKIIRPEAISRAGMQIAEVEIRNLPRQVLRSLSWLTLARSAQVRAEKFVHLWLAVRAITDFGQTTGKWQMKRVRTYTATMGFGIGGVLSPKRIEELNVKIKKAYDLRTALMHKDDDSRITLSALEELESVAFQIVDFEMAKLGLKIPS